MMYTVFYDLAIVSSLIVSSLIASKAIVIFSMREAGIAGCDCVKVFYVEIFQYSFYPEKTKR